MEARNVCQWRWKLNTVDRLYRKIYGIYMDFGTALHETIELVHCKDPDPTIDIEITVFFFKKKFEYLFWQHVECYQSKELVKLWTPVENGGLRPDQFLDAGERILRRFHECDELRTARVMFNELELYEKIDRHDGLDISFKGYVDLVIRTRAKNGKDVLYVCDFKTCSWGWPREKLENRNLHFQLLLYKHFLCKKFGLDPSVVRCAFVLLKRAPRKTSRFATDTVCPVEFIPLSAGPVAVQRAVDELNRDITKLSTHFASGTLEKNRKSCIDEKWGEVCPYYQTEHCV